MAIKTVIFWGQSNMEGVGNLQQTAYADGALNIAPHLDVPTTSPIIASDGISSRISRMIISLRIVYFCTVWC